jgi:hypothetical protein
LEIHTATVLPQQRAYFRKTAAVEKLLMTLTPGVRLLVCAHKAVEHRAVVVGLAADGNAELCRNPRRLKMIGESDTGFCAPTPRRRRVDY